MYGGCFEVVNMVDIDTLTDAFQQDLEGELRILVVLYEE